MRLLGFVRLLESYVKLWKLIMPLSRTWKVLEKRSFSNWLWKSFGFLFGKILKFPKMDITYSLIFLYHIKNTK